MCRSILSDLARFRALVEECVRPRLRADVLSNLKSAGEGKLLWLAIARGRNCDVEVRKE